MGGVILKLFIFACFFSFLPKKRFAHKEIHFACNPAKIQCRVLYIHSLVSPLTGIQQSNRPLKGGRSAAVRTPAPLPSVGQPHVDSLSRHQSSAVHVTSLSQTPVSMTTRSFPSILLFSRWMTTSRSGC